MTNHTHYYGEIVARIARGLYSIDEYLIEKNLAKSDDKNGEDLICEISADAARVFDHLEDLSGEHVINWRQALDYYIIALREFISSGQIPVIVDLILIASNSIGKSSAMDVSKSMNWL